METEPSSAVLNLDDMNPSSLKKLKEGVVLKETDGLTLQSYLRLILDGACVASRKEDILCSAGQNIYERIMKKKV